MAAQVVTGIAKATTTGTQLQPALAFTHKLMQVRFKIVKDASFEDGKKVTEIVVKDVKTSAILDIATGELTFDDAAADKTLRLPIVAGTKDEITAGGGTKMDGCVMLEPVGTDGSITLTVTAGGVVYDDISVSLTGTKNGEAGTSHLITLTFKRGGITPSATITNWSANGSGSADVGVPPPPPPVVGDYYYSDGSYSTELKAGKTATGLVYYLDPRNPRKYKVMSLEESSTKLVWAANYDYAVSGARSYTDGKANSAAIKKAFDVKEAGIAITHNDFADAFPAAAYCYKYKGKAGTDAEGSWHLPAKNELQWVWCAYNGKDPINWNHSSASSEAEIAQGLWNNRIKEGGGTVAGITSDYFWSSTEAETTIALYVHFPDGFTDGTWKKNDDDDDKYYCYVRCVRDL